MEQLWDLNKYIVDMTVRKGVLISVLFLFTVLLKGQEKSFPYKFTKSDLFLLPLGLALEEYSSYKQKQMSPVEYSELLELDYNNINILDRSAVHNWDCQLESLSDKTRTVLVNAPIILMAGQLVEGNFKNTLVLGAMYVETLTLISGLTSTVKTTAQRKRPYLYTPHLTIDEKAGMLSGSVTNSFFSGHTSRAFASAVFLSKTFTDIYGKSWLSTTVWATSLSVACLTGYLRYESGMHFPSDVFVGALVGSAVGYLVPVLHKKKRGSEKFDFELSAGYFRLTYTI